MLKNIEAVLFDLDGTLVDSMWMWKDIDIEYLGKHKVAMPADLQERIEGKSFHDTAVFFKEEFHIPDSLEMIKATWIEMAMDKYTNKVPLKPGALEFLKYCKSHAIKVGIASSNNIALIRALLSSLGIESYFDSVHTCCDVLNGKPAPDVYLYVAKELDVEPSKCLVFEDIVNGILAGKRAGMQVCAVDDAYSKYQEDEKRSLADYYIQDYREIVEKINKENYEK